MIRTNVCQICTVVPFSFALRTPTGKPRCGAMRPYHNVYQVPNTHFPRYFIGSCPRRRTGIQPRLPRWAQARKRKFTNLLATVSGRPTNGNEVNEYLLPHAQVVTCCNHNVASVGASSFPCLCLLSTLHLAVLALPLDTKQQHDFHFKPTTQSRAMLSIALESHSSASAHRYFLY